MAETTDTSLRSLRPIHNGSGHNGSSQVGSNQIGSNRSGSRATNAQTFSATTPLPDYMIAASEEMRELVSVVRAVAPAAITVLLVGESGTGKEVFARLIHDLSDRREGPFVTVNCGAIPEGLIESELFGHEKGAFTGAVQQRKGFFEAARSGTIFLDEIGEMPLAAQVKLLRVLETGSFTRVGSTTQLTTDARVVAATNRDLDVDVRAGTFRADLFYRLRAIMLRIPPLRNRREDIPFLIESMLEQFVEKHHLTEMPSIEPAAIELLINNEWRGNVRELRNVLEQLVILACSVNRADDRCVITFRDVERALSLTEASWNTVYGDRTLPVSMPGPKLQDQTERELLYRALIELRNDIHDIKEMLKLQSAGVQVERQQHSNTLALPAASKEIPPVESLEDLEKRAIGEALARFRGNRRQAANALGISERTLYRKMKEQGLDTHQPSGDYGE